MSDKLTIGSRVITELGAGEIIGIDLPGSRAERFVVLLDSFKYKEPLCFFHDKIKKENPNAK